MSRADAAAPAGVLETTDPRACLKLTQCVSTLPDGYDNARRVSYKQLPGSGGDLNEIADVWGILGVGLMPYLIRRPCVCAFASMTTNPLVFSDTQQWHSEDHTYYE